MISPRLQKIDLFLDGISRNLEFSIINPKNLANIRAKFLKDKQNPNFNYDPADPDLDTMCAVLQQIQLGSGPVDTILDDKRRELIKKIQFLQSVGTEQFTKRSLALYKKPNKKLIEQAYKILKLPKVKKHKRIKRLEARSMIKFAFKQLGVKWRLLNKDMVTSARVNPLTRTLELRKKERFSKHYVRRLIVHEIGTHVVRAENAADQPLKVFLHGLANYLETEEGLAVYSEYLTGVLNHSILRNYAGRVVAVNYALTHDFKSTFNHMSRWFSPKMAWKLTLRAKRGTGDTSKPGAYTKDVLYLRGYYKIKSYVNKGKDLNELYYGKIGIGDIDVVKKIPGVVKPKCLPFDLFATDMITQDMPLPETKKEKEIIKEVH